MNTLLVFVLLAIAIIIVGVWLLRRRGGLIPRRSRVSRRKRQMSLPPRAELQEPTEVVPVVPYIPQPPLPTPPDAPIPATIEVSSGEDGAAFPKFEEVQTTPFPQQLISTSIKDDSEPPEASHGDPPVME